MGQLFFKLMTKITAYLDPRLQKYRPAAEEVEPEIFLPESKQELIALLRSCDENVLSDAERRLIAGAMAFPIMPVQNIMHKKDKLTYLAEDDTLDPLTLDRLYKTGEDSFPVRDAEKNITGLLRLDRIDTLKVTEDKVAKHMNTELCFIRADYSFEMALAAFVRTGNDFAFVIDKKQRILGFLKLADIMDKLLGFTKNETFSADRSLSAVATRRRK